MELQVSIPKAFAGLRLDQALANLFPEYSREKWTKQIKEGRVWLEGLVVQKPSHILQGEEAVACEEIIFTVLKDLPEARPLDILYEDEALLVVNKPAGLTMHPGAGQPRGTLLNALLHHAPELSNLPRAGIIHRLDKETSGLLVVAKETRAYQRLVADLAARKIKRIYEALVLGNFSTLTGTVDVPIGRDPYMRTKMAAFPKGGSTTKLARTHYQVLMQHGNIAHLRLALETGRTHQIRVHMAFIQHPLIADKVYGGGFQKALGMERQALHAKSLGLYHPLTDKWLSFESNLPEDFQTALVQLKEMV